MGPTKAEMDACSTNEVICCVKVVKGKCFQSNLVVLESECLEVSALNYLHVGDACSVLFRTPLDVDGLYTRYVALSTSGFPESARPDHPEVTEITIPDLPEVTILAKRKHDMPEGRRALRRRLAMERLASAPHLRTRTPVVSFTASLRAVERNRKGIPQIEALNIICIEDEIDFNARRANDEIASASRLSSSAKLMFIFTKAHRHFLFASWLVRTYGVELLNQGSGVLDVAGGKGELGVELARLGVKSILLEPNVRGISESTQDEEHNTNTDDTSHENPSKLDGEHHPATSSTPSELPPTDISAEDMTRSASDFLAVPSSPTAQIPTIRLKLDGDGSALLSRGDCAARLVASCSAVVGMHPDQATEAIVDLSARLGVPFAVLPCCVMPSLFPTRVDRRGCAIRSHSSFCDYLLAKAPLGETYLFDDLPFAGRSRVIYSLSKVSAESK